MWIDRFVFWNQFLNKNSIFIKIFVLLIISDYLSGKSEYSKSPSYGSEDFIKAQQEVKSILEGEKERLFKAQLEAKSILEGETERLSKARLEAKSLLEAETEILSEARLEAKSSLKGQTDNLSASVRELVQKHLRHQTNAAASEATSSSHISSDKYSPSSLQKIENR